MDNHLNSPNFPEFLIHQKPPPSAVSTTGNSQLRPEINPFYPWDYGYQDRELRECVLGVKNHCPPPPSTGPAALNQHLVPDVFYLDDTSYQNLALRDNSGVYSLPVPAKNLHQLIESDPFYRGGKRLTDNGVRVNPSFPDVSSIELEFARLKLLDVPEHTSFSEMLSSHGRAASEGGGSSVYRNNSSVNWLRGIGDNPDGQPPQLSNVDLRGLRALAAAQGYMLPQTYSAFDDHFQIPDSYWINRDSNGFKNILGDNEVYNQGMLNVNGYKPRNGFNFSNRKNCTFDANFQHIPLCINGVNQNNSVSSIPSPRNGYIHRSTQRVNYSSIEDLKGMVCSEAMDQYGCHFLHQKLHERKPEDIQMILSEVKDHIHMLMFDRLGNYVIQKLFKVCDEEQMSQLVFSVTADDHLLMAVCLDSQGSQSMQKFLECLMTPEQISHMISIFRHITVPLVNNQVGSRVIQHCFNIFPAVETEKILNVIVDNCFQIATNRSGCCLLQVLITKDSPRESQRRIIAGIISNVHELSKNQFGNYVVQHVLGLEIPNLVSDMIARLRGNFVSLSMDKYASNVVERLIKASQEIYAPQIINEIISSPSFLNVVLDPYGNYVVQSAKKHSTGAVRKTLNNLILEHSSDLHSHLYGKNVLLNKERTRHCI